MLAVLVFAVPSWRRRVTDMWHKARAATAVLRSPTKLLAVVRRQPALSQVLFAVALGACVKAFGEDLPLSSLVLINTVVSLFAGLLPVPGGMGVSEAGLTLGLTTAGLPERDRLRHRPRLPLRQLLPAADLGVLLPQLARQAPLPLTAHLPQIENPMNPTPHSSTIRSET